MNQSISNAMLFNLVIIFVIVLLAFFVGSLSYSKASKVNNRIVEEIEKYGEAATTQEEIKRSYARAHSNIRSWLDYGDRANESQTGTGIGYRKVANAGDCQDGDVYAEREDIPGTVTNVRKEHNDEEVTTDPYEYCVYRIEQCAGTQDNPTNCYTYYRVITYMYFDIPIISELVKLPITGETMGFKLSEA